MTAIELLVVELNSSAQMVKMTLGDFTDAEMMVRPAPGANHPLWQLGHLTGSEAYMMNQVKPGAMPELPAGFDDRFDNKNNKSDAPKSYGATRQELLDTFAKVRAGTIALIQSLKPEDLDKPSPNTFGGMCSTIGSLLSLVSSHTVMHLGQMQVARRKVGKPVLF